MIPQTAIFNPLGAGDLKFYQPLGLSIFGDFFIFLSKPVLLIVMVQCQSPNGTTSTKWDTFQKHI